VDEMRGREHAATFKRILKQVETGNCERIMERARLANRLAKLVEGSSRHRAYAVKHRALKALALGFPRRVYVSRDRIRPHLLVVKCLTNAWGLHAPEEVFEGRQFNDRAA
jgi:hypothetical protein